MAVRDRGQISRPMARMQTRRPIQEFLLLLNRPGRWAEFHARHGITGEGVRLWSTFYREQIRLWPTLPRVNLRPAVLTAALDNYEKDGNLKAALEAALGVSLMSPHSTRTEAQGEKPRERQDQIIERLAWEGRLRTVLRAQLGEVYATTLQSAALGRAAKAEGFDFAAAFSIVTSPAYLQALPALPAPIRRRLMICSVPGCGRAFVRAMSKPAQKDCPRCRRRWSPKQRVALKEVSARRTTRPSRR